MKRRILSLISVVISFAMIVTGSISVYAEVDKVNVSQGLGKSPVIEVVRADEEDVDYSLYTLSSNVLSENNIDLMTRISISTVDDLLELAKRCRLDTWSRDKYVMLEKDIVIDGTDEFKYIPTFGGIFDGNNHTISGVALSADESYVGLFCETQPSACIMNLNVECSVIPDGRQVATGGLVGDNYGTICNCTVSGNVDGYDYTGIVTGYNETTGQIIGCNTSGYVKGMHFTGGIAGYNAGTISGCTNNAKVNISSIDDNISITDIDPAAYVTGLLNLGNQDQKDSTSVLNSYVDTGGIAGYSSGTILSCNNNARIGYEHVGYNVGGIVGRQNGYVSMCINGGNIYGRKDVGGIVGQAEPYVVVDFTDDIIGQLTDNMNTLHDLVSVTLKDAGNESNLITGRLNVVKSFTDRALNDTSYLSNETQTFINGMADAGNQVLDRVDYAMDQSTKSGGVFDKTKNAVSDAKQAADNLNKTVHDLDIYQYMSDEEKSRYETAKDNLNKSSEAYEKYYKEFYESDYNYFYYRYINQHHKDEDYYGVSSNIIPRDSENNNLEWPLSIDDKSSYETISKLVHYDDTVDPAIDKDFPTKDEEYAAKDAALSAAATAYGNSQVESLASAKFSAEYGVAYSIYLEENTQSMIDVVMAHEDEMSESVRTDAGNAIGNVKDSMGNLEGAVGETKSIVDNINSRADIVMPTLSDEYKLRSNSLIANIQGMSDNLGFLNNEMNSSNQQLVSDMSEVNDQFNVIMLLIADAIDGALDMDYSTVYEDNSEAVAEECVDATIADSVNNGIIMGDIDSAGIAGTMAIEYDFDMESDITGIKDAAGGTTYKSKCVLRRNKNEGKVEGLKNYVGGIVGLQEMGTVLGCTSFGRLCSTSGDYVGGISGKSLSTIRNCSTKCILSGREYVGGITGQGYDIFGCLSIPNIMEADSYYAAIAGDNSQEGRVMNNYFVSDDLAGINRISYSGKAEPCSYNEIMGIENAPAEFGTMRISYIVDDETLKMSECKYGGNIDYTQYPVPDNITDDEYVQWDIDEITDISMDYEVVGERVRYLTTLAGIQLRDNNQSAVLVDGHFSRDDMLTTELGTSLSEDDDVLEVWNIKIPVDGANTHTVRYRVPTGVTKAEIRVSDGEKLNEVELSEMGQYLLFDVIGNTVSFTVYDRTPGIIEQYGKYIAALSVVLVVIIFLIVLNKKRRKKKIIKNKPDKATADSIEDSTDNESGDLEIIDI